MKNSSFNWNVQPPIKGNITPTNFNILVEFKHAPQGMRTLKTDTEHGFKKAFQLRMRNVYEVGGNCFDVTIRGMGKGIDFEETGKLITDMMKAYREVLASDDAIYTRKKRADYILLQSIEEKAAKAIEAGRAVQIFYRINSVGKALKTAYCRNLEDLESIIAHLKNGTYGTESDDSSGCDYWHFEGMKII